MAEIGDIRELEQAAYRTSYSDGIVDVFVGLSLVWIGVAWIWLDDLAGVAGILPAVMVAAVLEGRKRIVQSRVGYVKWREPRRRWERRNVVVVLGAGIALFGLGIVAFLIADSRSDGAGILGPLGPGLLAFLLALLALGLGFLMSTGRMFAYAASLALGGLIAAGMDANPGAPLLAAGLVIAVTGAVLLIGFLRGTPSMGEE
jgi:hypothetical protein